MTDKNNELEIREYAQRPTMSDLLCIVSPHKKGFWQAEIYFSGWEEGYLRDAFFTGKIGGTKEQIINRLNEQYQNPKIVDGVTGYCDECGEEYCLLERECTCGGIVNDP